MLEDAGAAVDCDIPQGAIDGMSSTYSQGYVRVQVHPQHVDSCDFEVHTPCGLVLYEVLEAHSDGQDMFRSDAFACASVGVLFQPPPGTDMDPDSGTPLEGFAVPNLDTDSVVVFAAVIHDVAKSSPQDFSTRLGIVMGHEVGHLYIRHSHSLSGMMKEVVDHENPELKPEDLDLLRDGALWSVP
jgi:hypothetical protein